MYTPAELLSLYERTIISNRDAIIKLLSPNSLVPFEKTKIITDQQKEELKALNKRDRYNALIDDFILARKDLTVYINFSRCAAYFNSVRTNEIFSFISNLLPVGLHDPLLAKGEELTPRRPATKLVILWIVQTTKYFHGIERSETMVMDGYDCQKCKTDDSFDLYIACPNRQSRAPGRKFDSLLAKFPDCPSLLVYSGDCAPVSGASMSAVAPGDYIIVSSSSKSKFDLAPEASHVSELCRIKQEDSFPIKVQVGKATRYSYEEGALVHCPEGITLHDAAGKVCIPALVMAKVKQNNDAQTPAGMENVDYFTNFVYRIIEQIL